jgi:hypothetical protein
MSTLRENHRLVASKWQTLSDPFEKLHLKFIEETLGVNCKASNDACRAELARFPLRNLIHASNCINVLDHILSSDNTLIYQIYNAIQTSNPWIKKTKYLLDSLGYSYLFDNNVNFKHQLINIKQRIKDQNLQNQNSNICQIKSSKLNFFRTFYNMGQRPSYVDSLVNISERAAISKIRTSAHLLRIERGRHTNILVYVPDPINIMFSSGFCPNSFFVLDIQ